MDSRGLQGVSTADFSGEKELDNQLKAVLKLQEDEVKKLEDLGVETARTELSKCKAQQYSIKEKQDGELWQTEHTRASLLLRLRQLAIQICIDSTHMQALSIATFMYETWGLVCVCLLGSESF